MEDRLQHFSEHGYGIFPYMVMCFPNNFYLQVPIHLDGYSQHSRFRCYYIPSSSIEKFPTLRKVCEKHAEKFWIEQALKEPTMEELCLVFGNNHGYYINRKGETNTKNTIPVGGALYSIQGELILKDGKHFLDKGNHLLINNSRKENIPKNLWQELTEIENIQERRSFISNDIENGENRFKLLAEEDPDRLFKVLGGNENDLSRCFWAFEYTYKDYIEECEKEYNQAEANTWDLKERSIERANDSGHYYVTGQTNLECSNGKELFFEGEYCEGYYVGIISTPYETDGEGNEHGILFD